MPSPIRPEVRHLMMEARAMEMLASEADVAPERLQDYWSLSADLVVLVTDIEALAADGDAAEDLDARVGALQHRLRDVAARLGDMLRT